MYILQMYAGTHIHTQAHTNIYTPTASLNSNGAGGLFTVVGIAGRKSQHHLDHALTVDG